MRTRDARPLVDRLRVARMLLQDMRNSIYESHKVQEPGWAYGMITDSRIARELDRFDEAGAAVADAVNVILDTERSDESAVLANKCQAELQKTARAEAMAYAWEQGRAMQAIGRQFGISSSRVGQILHERESDLRRQAETLVPLRAVLEALANADQA